MFRDKLNKILNKNLKLKEPKETSPGIQEGDYINKKKIENLVFFVVILIITIFVINYIWNGSKKTNKQETESSSKQLASQNASIEEKLPTNSNTEKDLETQLENILSKIQGVGEVKVFVNYSESSQVVAMYNETTKSSNTEENDTSGGIRKIQETDSQKDIIYQEQNGEKTPITQKVIEPKIEGAIITAKGANNVETKSSIVQAVEAATGLASHKIQVFEMN